jgi:hypothetical protein
MLGKFCGPRTRYFQSGAHGGIICKWHRKVTDAKWGASTSYRYLGIYTCQLLHGFSTAINIIETTHFMYCTILIKCLKKAFRPDKLIINIIYFYSFFYRTTVLLLLVCGIFLTYVPMHYLSIMFFSKFPRYPLHVPSHIHVCSPVYDLHSSVYICNVSCPRCASNNVFWTPVWPQLTG